MRTGLQCWGSPHGWPGHTGRPQHGLKDAEPQMQVPFLQALLPPCCLSAPWIPSHLPAGPGHLHPPCQDAWALPALLLTIGASHKPACTLILLTSCLRHLILHLLQGLAHIGHSPHRTCCSPRAAGKRLRREMCMGTGPPCSTGTGTDALGAAKPPQDLSRHCPALANPGFSSSRAEQGRKPSAGRAAG